MGGDKRSIGCRFWVFIDEESAKDDELTEQDIIEIFRDIIGKFEIMIEKDTLFKSAQHEEYGKAEEWITTGDE